MTDEREDEDLIAWLRDAGIPDDDLQSFIHGWELCRQQREEQRPFTGQPRTWRQILAHLLRRR